MSGFSKGEIKVLKLIDRNGFSSKTQILYFLEQKMMLSHDKSMDFYALWFLNREEGSDYENVETVNRETRPLLKILQSIQRGELSIDDIPEKYYGENLPYCKSSRWNSYEPTPCIEISSDRIILNLSREDWEEPGISGLHEEDLWRYYESVSYYSDSHEEYDDEEFDYFLFNDETIELLNQLAVLSKNNTFLNYLETTKKPESDKMAPFIEKILPRDIHKDLVQEYLYDIGFETTRVRQNAVKEVYNEEIKYNRSGGNDHELTIPIDEFIGIIEKNNPFTFDGILDLEINPIVDLEHVWFDTGYYDGDQESIVTGLNNNLKGIVDKFSEEDFEKLITIRNDFNMLIDSLNFTLGPHSWRDGELHISPDGRLSFYDAWVDFKNEMITFTYDDRKHKTTLNDFVDWTQGSVIKFESVRFGKRILKESKKMITKISIFDFDSTLADTPDQETGIPQWENSTGMKYPHIGWYSKRESLDTKIFDIELKPLTIKDYFKESENDNTLMIMLTGRMPNQSDQVEEILTDSGITFDEYHYKERGDTFTSKINTIKKLLSQNPDVVEIEMWEDRLNHADGFEQWGEENGVSIKVNRVIQ